MNTAWSKRTNLLKVTLVVAAALVAAWLVALVGTQPRLAAALDAPKYTVTDLGAFPRAINNSGQVVGGTSGDIAFLYEMGSMTELGVLPGGSSSAAWGINDVGQIVGESNFDETSGGRAILYENGTMTNLGTLPNPGTYGRSVAYDINDSGQVVGVSDTMEGSTDGRAHEHAFLFEDGTMTDLHALGSNDRSMAVAINNSGQIVGSEGFANGGGTAFLYENGNTTDLSARMGVYRSNPEDISDSGQIVGNMLSSIGQESEHAFLYDTDGPVTDLGTLPGRNYSIAVAINSSGQIVGYSDLDDVSNATAFLYNGGAMTNLNDLIPADSGWQLSQAIDINDSGTIVGWGINPNGQRHGFLLTPPYTFSGFFAPVDNYPTLNVVPQPAGTANQLLRFSLGSDQGTDIFENAYPSSTRVACPSESPEDVVEETAAAEPSNLKYSGNGQYTYSWKTEKAWKGTCRELNLRLKDGTDHKALFQFTR